jgi:hypothetical protein
MKLPVDLSGEGEIKIKIGSTELVFQQATNMALCRQGIVVWQARN